MKKILCFALVLCILFGLGAASAADAVTLSLSDDGTVAPADAGINVFGSIIMITRPGEYVLTGTLSDGMISVNCTVSGEVILRLDGVKIHHETGPAIQIGKCDPKVQIVLADGSENLLSDGAELSLDADEEPNGVIFSRSDLEITGTGKLTVIANAYDGIVSKDDLKIGNGEITVRAYRHGLRGKDSVEISGGVLEIKAGKDGIRTTNKKKADKGYLSLTGGSVRVACGDDPLYFVTSCEIRGAELTLYLNGADEDD